MILQCYYNLCLEFLFINRYFLFWCDSLFEVFSTIISFLKFKTCFIAKYFQEISLSLAQMLDVSLLEFLKLCWWLLATLESRFQLQVKSRIQVLTEYNLKLVAVAKSVRYSYLTPVVRTNHTQVSYLTKMQLMHIRLPDKHNVSNHFCLQAFLSEQSFPSLSMPCCFSANNYFVVFHSRFQFFSQSNLIIAASSNFITAVDIAESYIRDFFLLVGP